MHPWLCWRSGARERVKKIPTSDAPTLSTTNQKGVNNFLFTACLKKTNWELKWLADAEDELAKCAKVRTRPQRQSVGASESENLALEYRHVGRKLVPFERRFVTSDFGRCYCRHYKLTDIPRIRANFFSKRGDTIFLVFTLCIFQQI
jgi:hypothetical protein